MSIARITTVTFNSTDAANKAADNYVANAPSEFPEAKQLLGIKVDENILVAVSLYQDKAAMERADAAREKRLDSNQDVKSVDTKIGEITLNHTN